MEDSLTRLGTDRIDLYQLHMPDPKTPISETLGVLAELVAEGKVREIGCSNFSTALLEEAAAAGGDGAPGFVSVQNQYNILYRDPEENGVLAECGRTGMAFLPYFPLALGLLSGKFRPGQPLPEDTRLTNMGDAAASALDRGTAGHRGRTRRPGPQRGAHGPRPGLRLVALAARRGLGHRRRHQTRADRGERGRRLMAPQRGGPGRRRRHRAALSLGPP